jgi:hypothetical protein
MRLPGFYFIIRKPAGNVQARKTLEKPKPDLIKNSP